MNDLLLVDDMVDNIKNIGISELIKNTERLVVDDSKSGTFNKISLTFTAKEFDIFTNAIDELAVLSSRSEFSDFIRKELRSDVAVENFRKRCINPIISSVDKIKFKGKVNQEKKYNDPDRNFYTRPFPVTEAFISICNSVNKEYDQTANISEARRVINEYCKLVNLIYENKSRKIDDFLQSIAPNTLGNIEMVRSDEWKSVELNIAKEIISWTAVEKAIPIKKEKKLLRSK